MQQPWAPTPYQNGLDYRPPALGQGLNHQQGGAPTVNLTHIHGRPSATSKPITGRPRLISRSITLSGGADEQAIKKVKVLREDVVAPALDHKNPNGISATRRLLAEALQGAPRRVNGHHKTAEAVRIFEWVKSRIRYVNDPVGQELFTAVQEVFDRGFGDCDDFTAVLAALFLAAGIQAKARIIQHAGAAGWSHIYPIALLDGKWRAFDATVEFYGGRRVRAGWEFPNATRRLDLELMR